MLDSAFSSVFGTADSLVSSVSTVEFLLCCVASILLGAAVAGIYMFRHTYSKNFVVTLALLPLIVQMVITLVNGNLGAGIAVMGVFNLVRFRSIPGSAKDIGSVFLAMAIGLATGMGFIWLAVIFTVIVAVVNVAYVASPFGRQKEPEKTLRITIPEDLEYDGVFDEALVRYTDEHELHRGADHEHGKPVSVGIRHSPERAGIGKAHDRRFALPERQPEDHVRTRTRGKGRAVMKKRTNAIARADSSPEGSGNPSATSWLSLRCIIRLAKASRALIPKAFGATFSVALVAGLAGCGVSASDGDAGSTGSISADALADAASTASFEEVAASFDVAALDLEYSNRDQDASYDDASATHIALDGSSASVEGDGTSADGATVTITQEGVYVVSGSLDDGQLVVEVPEDVKVQVVLAGAAIHNEDGPAIYVKQADKCFVTLADGTQNTLTDGATYTLEDDSDEPYATLFSRADLTLNGSGALDVTSSYRHAVCSKDDLVITGGTYVVTAVEDALRGRDCVKILEGDFTLNAGGDGIKSNKDTKATKGFVSIDGGTFVHRGGRRRHPGANLPAHCGWRLRHRGGGRRAAFESRGNPFGRHADHRGGRRRVPCRDEARHR